MRTATRTLGPACQSGFEPMIREHLLEKRLPTDPLFRWRGGGVSRLEGFSDGVFAVILTLLIASTSVPSTFHELWQTIRDLPVFLVTFAHRTFNQRLGPPEPHHATIPPP